MEESLLRTTNNLISNTENIIEAIMTSVLIETIKEVEIRSHLTKYETTSTKATMTEYMPNTRGKDRQNLLKNANKTTEMLTKEAYESRIVELQVEIAKRDEMNGALEENIKGLKKCISAQEDMLLKYEDNPKEGEFLSIQVNQAQLIDIKRSQEETKKSQEDTREMLAECMKKLALFEDFASVSKEQTTDQHAKDPVHQESDIREGNDGEKDEKSE